MSAQTIFAAFMIAGVSVGIAQDSGLVITLGRLETNSSGAKQILAVENKTSRNFSYIHVECGFYAGASWLGLEGHRWIMFDQVLSLMRMQWRLVPAMLIT
jgi:hypothetical protein